MKQKLIVRIVCIVLVIMLLASVLFVVASSLSANAAVLSDNNNDNSYSQLDGISTAKSDFVASVGANISSQSVSSAKAGDKGFVNDDYVNLRSGAGTNYSVVTCMRKNTAFTFVDGKLYNSKWYKIKLTSNSKTGYILNTYASVESSSSSNSGYINDDYVNLRKGAGTNYSVVTCMRKNTTFTFISTSLYNSKWYHIRLSNGTTGYVIKDYATKKSTSSSSQGSSSSSTSSTTGVKISDSSETLYKGTYYTLTATAKGTVKWSSSNTSVATVSSSGVVYAKSNGTATIKAAYSSSSALCKITVKSGSSVNISNKNVSIRRTKSVFLTSSTSGVKWKSSNTNVATVSNGIVNTKDSGYAAITAYTSSGASTCLLHVYARDNVKFAYVSPNSAPLNSTVNFKAITDTDRIAVRFVVSNGSTSYTVNASSKVKDGNTYVWTGSHKLSKSGKWTVKAYAKYKTSNSYLTTSGNGEGEVFVTSSTNKTTTVCSERRASDEIINLIANYEGFLPTVTNDSITSDPTLGYGKVIYSGEQFYNNLTKNEAYAYLCQTVNKGGYTTKTNKFLLDNGIKFNQRQFDSLVSFAYNVGASAIYNDSDLQSVLLSTGSGSSSVKAGASGYVNASDVNLRKGAGTNYSVVTCMNKNTKFTYVDGKVYNSNWYKIKLSNGTTGYIYKSYASLTGASRDLNNVNKQHYLNEFLAYHHAAGSCYWGLLYRRIDEAEVFFYGDYVRDGQKNKKGFDYTCSSNYGFSIS